MLTIRAVNYIYSLVILILGIKLLIGYIKNNTYSRDAYLAIACILSFPFIVLGDTYTVVVLDCLFVLQYLLSIYMLGNVKYNSSKWLSNSLRSIILISFIIITTRHEIKYYFAWLVLNLILIFTYTIFNQSSTRAKIGCIFSHGILAFITYSYFSKDLFLLNIGILCYLSCLVIYIFGRFKKYARTRKVTNMDENTDSVKKISR